MVVRGEWNTQVDFIAMSVLKSLESVYVGELGVGWWWS